VWIKIFASSLIILVFLGMPTPVLANGPPPPPWLEIDVRNLPEDAIFADILIRIGEVDPNFIGVNKNNLSLFGLSAQAEIVGFNANGFMSFTFHYRDAVAEIYTDEHKVVFARGEWFRELEGQFGDLRRNYSDMKIALLDYAGNVISVSDQFTLPRELERGMPVTFRGLSYDHQTGEVRVFAHVNSLAMAFRIIFIVVIVLLSIGIEVVTGLFFRFSRRKLGLILCVNMGTQTAMWIAYFGFMWQLPHIVAVIILEVCIYVTEFVVYRKSSIMADESTHRILLYTVIANTTSLVLGIVVFWG